MMIGVLGSLAEYERELTKERAALKRATSRANGTRFGRPRKVQEVQDIATAKRMKEDGHTIKDIAKYLGVSRATLYRYLSEFTTVPRPLPSVSSDDTPLLNAIRDAARD